MNQQFRTLINVLIPCKVCCTGWSTAYLTTTGEFGLTGFDFDCAEIVGNFCQNNEVVNMAGGAHHIILTSLTKVLIVSNRPDNVIEFNTAKNITALHSSFFDCFIHFQNFNACRLLEFDFRDKLFFENFDSSKVDVFRESYKFPKA